MKKISGKTNKVLDVLLWASVLCVLVLLGYMQYGSTLVDSIKAIIWILGVAIMFPLVYFTAKGKEWYAFFKDAKQEFQKIVWPTRQETVQTTTIVMVMVTVTGFVLWGIDSGMMWFIGKLTHLG